MLLQLQLQLQLHCITLHYATLITLHYATLHYTALHNTTLHYATLHYTTLHCTTLITPHHNYNCNYTAPNTLHYSYSSATLQLRLQLQLHYTTLHPAVVGDVTTAAIATTPKTQLQPPCGSSVDSLCHPCITATHLSYSVLSLKLPPPPCAVLLALYTQRIKWTSLGASKHSLKPKRAEGCEAVMWYDMICDEMIWYGYISYIQFWRSWNHRKHLMSPKSSELTANSCLGPQVWMIAEPLKISDRLCPNVSILRPVLMIFITKIGYQTKKTISVKFYNTHIWLCRFRGHFDKQRHASAIPVQDCKDAYNALRRHPPN